MRKIYITLILLIIICPIFVKSQPNTFHFENGFTTRNVTAVFGTKGVSNPSNTPGSREHACSWTDLQGNYWLFGGQTYTSTAANSRCDMWKYDYNTQEWTWMHGNLSTSYAGNYGTQGVAAATNVPGARYGAASWVDNMGNLWMFGGAREPSSGITPLYNDIWKYDVSTNMWTWIAGSNLTDQNSVFGVTGTPNPANVPGSRYLSTFWKDSDGNLMLYGGLGIAQVATKGFIHQLWKFDITSYEWTFLNGSKPADSTPTYGTKGVATSTNKPGSRYSSAGWQDENGNILIYGGYGYQTTTSSTVINDLWKYSLSSGMWTWMGGTANNQLPTYGTSGLPSASNSPGSRCRMAYWQDSLGMFWMMGGNSHLVASFYADMWRYNPYTNMWAHIGGSKNANPAGVYPTTPGGRMNITACYGSNGKFVFFGGYGEDGSSTAGPLCDLWSYEYTSLSPQITAFTPSISCGTTATLTITGTNLTSSTLSIGATTISPLSVNTATRIVAAINSPISGSVNITTIEGTTTSMGLFTLAPNPTVSVNSGTICSGNSFSINPTGADTYTVTGNSFVVTPTLTTTYSITGTSTEGCVSANTAVSSITVNSLPDIIVISSNTLLCTGQTVSLTASGAETYVWNTSTTTSVIAVSPTITTNYTVTGTDINGCDNTSVLTQSVDACTGILELRSNDQKILLYPNPNTGSFQIETKNIKYLIITNTLGEIITRIEVSKPNLEIKIPESKAGMYYVNLISDDGISSIEKVVVQ